MIKNHTIFVKDYKKKSAFLDTLLYLVIKYQTMLW